jgi:mono/diheme cytochrome c family protein
MVNVRLTTAVWLLGTAVTVSAVRPTQSAARTVGQGVYTDEQAALGHQAFHTHCERCHLADLGGDQLAPALVGDDFLRRWDGATVGAIFSTIKSSMPPDVPRTATDDEYAAIVSYVLKMNQFPAGATPLSKDPAVLEQIQFKSGIHDQS